MAGFVLLILSLIPTSDLCFQIVGFIISSLALFFIIIYFLHPVLLKAAPLSSRIKEAVFSLSKRKLLGGVFLMVFFTINLISYKVFHHYPHIFDSTSQLFQAKIFLGGKLTAEAPQPRKFFSYNNVILDTDGRGRWYSQYPPGHAFLLFLGLLINAPWLINPLFGSLSVILLYFLGRELYGEATGRLCLFLGAVSPFLLFMSSEFMNHTTAGFFIILGFYWGFRAEKITVTGPAAPKTNYSFLAGAALGMAHLIRPYSALVISLPLLVYLVLKWAKQKRWREIVSIVAPLILFAGIFLTYNTLTNGHPFLFGYHIMHKFRHGIGFGYSIDVFPPHTPGQGVINLFNKLNQLNLYLFQWPGPSLIFVAILLGSGRMRKESKLLMLCLICLMVGYFFYGLQHLLFGPRFMYEGSFILILLTARGIFLVKDIMGPKAEGYLWGVLGLCVLVGMLNIRSQALSYSNNYWNFNPSILENIRKKEIKNALVFSYFYPLVFPGVEPDMEAEVIFARDMGEEQNKELIRRYPGRKLYRTLIYDIHPYYPFERLKDISNRRKDPATN